MRLISFAIAAILPLAAAAAEEDSGSVRRLGRNRLQKIHKSAQKGEEQYDPYLGLPADKVRRGLQDTMSMSMPSMCTFCPDGLDDPDLTLPTDDGSTCGTAKAFADTLMETDAQCSVVQLAEAFCCPDVPSCSPIVDIAVGNPDFSTLVAALTAADLVEALSGDGPFTVFAPTNAAFDALPAGTVEALLADIPTLTAILTYHVVSGKVMSTDLVDGPVPTLNGADVVVDLSNGVMINDANVVAADIDACNGVIHVIDKVLLPPEPEPEPEMSMSMPAVPATLPATTEAPPDPAVPATLPAVTDPAVPATLPSTGGATGTSPSKAAKEEDHSMQTKASKSAQMLGKSVKAEKVAKATKSTKAEKSEPKAVDTKAKKMSSKSAAPKTPKEPMAKVQKEPTPAAAKVTKESKSSKADVDAKAEKMGKSGKSGKGGKSSTPAVPATLPATTEAPPKSRKDG